MEFPLPDFQRLSVALSTKATFRCRAADWASRQDSTSCGQGCRLVGTMPHQHQEPPINRPKSGLSYLIVSYSRFDLNMGMAQKRGASEPTKLLVVCIRPAISWVSINFDGGITKKI